MYILFSYNRVIFLSLHESKDRLIHLLTPLIQLSPEPSTASYLVNWIEMLHSLWFPSKPIAWPDVSWESFRAFSVNVHFLNYCPPPSFSSSMKNQRGGKLKWLKKKDFTQELLQGRKRNLSLELGSTPMATRKSGGLQPRSRVRMTKTKHPEWRGL